MSTQGTIKRLNEKTAIIHNDVGCYAISEDYSNTGTWHNILQNDSKVNWETDPVIVMGKKVVPYGVNNDLPVMIRNVMDDNNLAPGIIERQIGLLYGDGPRLFREEYGDNGEIVRMWYKDNEILNWCAPWIRRYLDMAMVEYKHLKGFFTRRSLNKGARIGINTRINKIEVVPAVDARLAFPENGYRLEDVKQIYVGDFENNCYKTGIATYPVWNENEPFANKVSMSYHNNYSFARNFYSVPSYYGALRWLMRSSDIPDIIKYLTENGVAVAFHIHSPAGYWDQKRDKLIEKYPEETPNQIDKRLEQIKDETFQRIQRVLAGKKNAGKFIETVDFYDAMSGDQLNQWKVEPIDQKIKDFIEAQLKVATTADSATTSGMGLHPSLSNLIVNGQLSSGAQMLYALKLFLASDVSIPEEVIFEPINQAIAANFPKSDLRMGFYRRIVQAEDSITSSERLKNVV
jgi:hypothetical protein